MADSAVKPQRGDIVRAKRLGWNEGPKGNLTDTDWLDPYDYPDDTVEGVYDELVLNDTGLVPTYTNYVVDGQVVDGTTVEVITPAAQVASAQAFHEPGHHDQKNHGRRGSPALSESQYSALDPANKRAKTAIVKELSATSEGKNTLDCITSFTEKRGGVSAQRKAIERVASGDETVSPSVRQKASDFVGAMNGFPPDKVPQLYRGFAIKMAGSSKADWDALEAPFQVGKRMNLNVSSFTSSGKKAEEFMLSPNGTRSAGRNSTRWKIIVDGHTHALPVERLSKFGSEKEWLSGGEFEVTHFSPATQKRPHYEVHVRQVRPLTITGAQGGENE